MKIGEEKDGKRGADFSLRSTYTNAPANPQSAIGNPKSKIQNPKSGFTLAELLVAMALFAVLMSSVVLLFVGSIRSAKTGYQQIDAFDKARSALTVVQNDLVSGFTSHQSADLHSFYGTPIGMTFVGLVSSSTGSGNFNVARITYVVYNKVINKGILIDDTGDAYPYRFPEALENQIVGADGTPISLPGPDGTMKPMVDQLDAYPYPLLRYVEVGATDLNTFPIPWGASFTSGSMAMTYRAALNQLCDFDSEAKQLTEEQRERVWMATCEMWIRMLAGGDDTVPINYWKNPNLHPDLVNPVVDPTGYVVNPLDYMVADNILSTYPPNSVTANYSPGGRYVGDTYMEPLVADSSRNRQERPFCAMGFFDYDMDSSFTDKLDPIGNGKKIANAWWNDPRSNAVHAALANGATFQWDCFSKPDFGAAIWDPRLPQAVTMSFWLMFESPYPGAPDFKRHFSLQINIPAAYERSGE